MYLKIAFSIFLIPATLYCVRDACSRGQWIIDFIKDIFKDL